MFSFHHWCIAVFWSTRRKLEKLERIGAMDLSFALPPRRLEEGTLELTREDIGRHYTYRVMSSVSLVVVFVLLFGLVWFFL